MRAPYKHGVCWCSLHHEVSRACAHHAAVTCRTLSSPFRHSTSWAFPAAKASACLLSLRSTSTRRCTTMLTLQQHPHLLYQLAVATYCSTSSCTPVRCCSSNHIGMCSSSWGLDHFTSVTDCWKQQGPAAPLNTVLLSSKLHSLCCFVRQPL